MVPCFRITIHMHVSRYVSRDVVIAFTPYLSIVIFMCHTAMCTNNNFIISTTDVFRPSVSTNLSQLSVNID